MDVSLPSGCNVFTDSDKFINYANGLATDYFLYNGQVIKGNSQLYNADFSQNYDQLEYLASNGNAYISFNFNRVLSSNYTVISDFSVQGAGGIYSIGSDYAGYFIAANSTDNEVGFKSNASLSNPITIQNSWGRKTYTHTLTNDNMHAEFTDGVTTVSLDRASAYLNGSIYLFSYYITNSTTGSSSIYSFKVYKDNVLIYDLIPVKRKSDNALGFYNNINDTFYSKSGGSGSLISGPVVASTSSCFDGTLTYKPETQVYFQALSFALCGLAFFLLFKIFLGRFVK